MSNFPLRSRDAARLLFLAKKKQLPLHDAADALVPAFEVAVRAAFAAGRKKASSVDAAAGAVASSLRRTMPALLLRGLKAGGVITAERLPQKRHAALRNAAAAKKALSFSFSAKNPRAIKWAKQHAGELITDISETTRTRIKNAVASFGKDAVDKIEAAVGDAARANVIARTETMRAVHEGQREAWDQAVDKGLLTGDEKRVWIVTDDDLLCPICEALDGQTTSLDGDYGDGIDAPPAHPNCRCTEGLE